MAWDYTLGVIGAGNMGAALVRGLVRAGALPAEQIAICDVDAAKTQALAEEFDVHVLAGNPEVAERSEYVLLALKPAMTIPVLREIDHCLQPEQVLISFATGISLAHISQTLTTCRPGLVRVMPNTPALVGAGVFAVASQNLPQPKCDRLTALLGAVGRVISVDDALMNAVTGLSGSGPAFVFVMIEALADGGVATGLPRAVALELAAQTVLGAAKMVLETGQHPGQLKDMVATPGGTTIAGLTVLEQSGLRAALIEAVRAAARRAHELSEGK
jgi:pyrroline-5-carboxylate reductase